MKDQQEIYQAPFHRSALKWDAAAALITTGLIATDSEASHLVLGNDHSASLHISDAGLYGTTGAVGLLYLSSFATHNDHAREAGFLGAEAVANAMALYSVVQLATGRSRPLEGDHEGQFWKNNSLGSSFPSGHSIATWSAATVLAHEYPHHWIPYLAYGTAAAVSITRFSGAQHFPADVFIGSAFGYFIGRHIFRAHCKPDFDSACSDR